MVDKYLADTKKFLLKSNKRKRDFQRHTKLSLPPTPVLTRWGTWLNAVAYHQTNFSAIKQFILTYKPDSKSTAFDSLKKILSGQKLQSDLFQLRKYIGISGLITSLEQHGITLEQQMSIVSQCKKIIQGTPFEKKLLSSLEKNPDLISYTGQFEVDTRILREYSPLVSVEVERSFSKYKAFLRPNRQRLTAENIRKFMIVNYNNFI